MKKLCFASIFNILVLAAKDTVSQIKIYTAVCKSIDSERTVYYDDTTISKIKKGSRSFPSEYKPILAKTDYPSLKSKIKENIIPLLQESLLQDVTCSIKDILFSDSSIPNLTPMFPSCASSLKDSVIRYQDLSSLLAVILYYSIISTKNSVYVHPDTDKITSLITQGQFLKTHPELKEKAKQDPNDHGIIDTYLNINDINYRELINSSNNIDIVHIHGLTWTNKVREFLVEKLKDETVTIRVFLLSPDSDFFEPYSYFIGKTKPYLIDKLDDVLSIWERNYCEATKNRTKPAGKLFVYMGHFFPSKSFYRFDNTIIVNPSSMTKNKTAYLPTILCKIINEEKESFFSAYLQEIDWIAENSLCIDASKITIQRSNFPQKIN